jgi:hypothetical protein
MVSLTFRRLLCGSVQMKPASTSFTCMVMQVRLLDTIPYSSTKMNLHMETVKARAT